VTSLITNRQVKEFINGKMARSTMASGIKARRRATESGEGLLKSVTLENGKQARHMVMVFTFGRMETSMRVNGRIFLSMVMDLISSETAILTKESTDMENPRASVSTSGRAEVSI